MMPPPATSAHPPTHTQPPNNITVTQIATAGMAATSDIMQQVGTDVIDRIGEAADAAHQVAKNTPIGAIATTIIENTNVLANQLDDLQQIASGGWILLSESARFFTIGKVAIAMIEHMYHMWNAWSSKTEWVGSFMAFVKTIEIDLVNGMKTFQHVEFLQGLERQLEETQKLLHTIQQRSKSMSFLLALSDQAALEDHKSKINARKSECLFGHVIEIKADTKATIAKVDQLSDLIRERQQLIKQLKEVDPYLEQHMNELKQACAMIEPSEEIRRYQRKWMIQRRIQKLKQMNEEERQAYVQTYLTTLIRPFPTSSAYILDWTLDLSSRTSFSSSSPTSSNVTLSAPPRSQLATRELSQHLAMTAEDQQRQLGWIAREMKRYFDEIDEIMRMEKEKQIEMDEIEAKLSLLATIIHTRRNIDSSFTSSSIESSALSSVSPLDYLDTALERLFTMAQQFHTTQVALGLILQSPQPTLDDLSQLTLIVDSTSASEFELYVREFRDYYAKELLSIDSALDLNSAAKLRSANGAPVTNGHIIAIKPPPKEKMSCGKSEATSIFIAFLCELYPRVFRATHFNPPLPESSPSLTPAPADSTSTADLRRIFPSLAWQLAQHSGFSVYYQNLVSNWMTLNRPTFDSMQPSDFITELFTSKLSTETSTQLNPNSEPNLSTQEEGRQWKVCMAIDAAHLSTNESTDGVRGTEFDPAFLAALDKQSKLLPDWMCFVLTIPPQSKFEKRVTGHVTIQITKPAIEIEENTK